MQDIRKGKVSSINYETGMVRVTYKDKGDSVTREFPMLDNGKEYDMPEVGQSVAVAHLSNGSSRGFVLGTFWSRKNAPYDSGRGKYRKDFSKTPGAAVQEFSEDSGEMVLRVPVLKLRGNAETELEGAELMIGANIKLTMDSPEAELTAQKLTWEKILMSVAQGALEAAMKSLQLTLDEDLTLDVSGDASLAFTGDMTVTAEGNVIEEITGDITRTAEGNVTEEITGDVSGKIEGTLKEEATGDVEISSQGNISLIAESALQLKDGTYNTSLEEICKCLENLGQTVGKG